MATGTRSAAALAGLCLLAATTGAAAGRAASTAPRVSAISLPALTGRSAVGTFSIDLVDRSRRDRTMPSGHRELMVQLWYPAADAAGPMARYMPAKIAALVEHEDHLPPGTVAGIRTRAYAEAAAGAGRHPVVLFSPGSSKMRSSDTALIENLASAGYIVAALDHTHEAELVEFPGGRIVRGSFVDTGAASNERALRARVADTRFLLNQLTVIDRRGPLRGHLALDEIGMFGFSLGGATAAATMLADPRLKAGADLDGSLYGAVDQRGLNRPFLLLIEPALIRLDQSIKALAHRLRGPHLILGLHGSSHESFTDFTWIKPQLAHISRAAAKLMQVGTVGPHALGDESTYLTAFFDRYLRHRPEPLLQHRSARHPDIVFLKGPK
jgi:dienelactone hydrolase